MKIITKYHCQKDGWVPDEICWRCGETVKKLALPAGRGKWYFFKDVGTPLPRVTDIISILDKPQLRYWYGQEVYRAMCMDPMLSEKEALAAPYKTSKKAADKGTDIHKMVAAEEYIIDELPENLKGYIQSYEKWRDAFQGKVIANEIAVYSSFYAGRIDRIIEDQSGKLWLIDFKTGKDLYPETALQLSAYKHAEFYEPFSGDSGKRFEWGDASLAAVNLKPDGTFAVKEYPDTYKVFVSAYNVWKWKEEN